MSAWPRPLASVPRLGRAVVVVVVLAFVGAGLHQAWTDSPTVDEGVDLASGLSAWIHRDLRMSPEHPVLPKLLATAPALAADPIVPMDAAWHDGDWFEHTDSVLSSNDEAGRLRRVVFLSRIVPLGLAVACAGVMYVLGRRLAGEGAGLLAAGLWLTTPYVLGLGHFQSIDIAFTLATLLVALTLLRHREAPTPRRAVAVGIALAVALTTRHTGLVLVPVALGVMALAPVARRQAARMVALAAAVGYAGLWLVYRGFDLTSPAGASGARFDGLVSAAGDRSLLARLVLAVPAPREWQAGFGYLTLTSEPRPAWLAGRAWEGNQWWFFPGSLVAKVPLPALLVLVLALGAWVVLPRARRVDLGLTIVAPALSLFLLTAVQPLALGLRLVLPSLALWMVAAGPVVEVLGRTRPRRVALVVLATLQVAALLAGSQHSLAWSPPPFRPAYQWVSDSNLDFGQDLWRVREWSEERDPWVAMIAPRGLPVGGAARPLIGADPSDVTGWVAVGTTSLTVVQRDALAWLRKYCPVGFLGGGSVLVYHFDEPPDPSPGPIRPVDPCLGAEVSRER